MPQTSMQRLPDSQTSLQAAARFMWEHQWARTNQLPPGSDWRTWLVLAGRGFGKTRLAAEWLAYQAVKTAGTRWAVVAPTYGDVRDTCVEGESGLLNILDRYKMVKQWNRSLGELTLKNGSRIKLFSADEPDRLRGPQHHGAWCFIAGTMIATPSGDKAIETLQVGDKVYTSGGIQRVLATGERDAEIWKVDFGSGVLVGSAEHPVMTQRGWVEMQYLRKDDSLYLWKDDGDITQRDTSTATKTGANFGSIASFGKKPTAQSHRVTKSITSTKSKTITAWKTSSASAPSNTEQNTPKQQKRSFAENVSNRLRFLTRQAAPTTAEPATGALANANGNSTPIPAKSAAKSFRHAAHVSVVSDASTLGVVGRVHNLTVDGEHDYYANGVLVHNCDELAAWRYPETWDQLQFGLRLGTDPRVVVTTTPKPTKLIRELTNRADVHVTRGSTFDNAKNLAPTALTQLLARYEGTRLGRQELYGEILNDVEGALWSLDLIDANRTTTPDILARVVVGVDPAVTSNDTSDETGIIVAGRDTEGHAYILADYSLKASPLEWAKRAIDAYDTHHADAIVVEVNNGGDMIPTLIRQIRPGIPVKTVRASRGKHTRAEPIAALYEQSRVHHTQPFTTLEDQMCSWTVDDPKSPDRLDALVWALTELMTGTSVTGYLAQLARWCEQCNLPMPKQATLCQHCGSSLSDQSHPLAR